MELNNNARSRCWCFTLNNHTENEVAHLHGNIFEACIDFAAQEEISESGTPHIQGYLHFQHAKSFQFMKDSLPRAHFEPARKWQAARQYCLKSKSRNGRQWEKNKKVNWVKPTWEEYFAEFQEWHNRRYPNGMRLRGDPYE